MNSPMQHYLDALLANPTVSGLVGGTLLVSVFWTLARTIPLKIWALITSNAYRHLVISVEILQMGGPEGDAFAHFDTWLRTLPDTKRRRLKLLGMNPLRFVTAPDRFYFRIGWTLYRFTKTRVEKENAPPQDRILVETIGRDPRNLEKLFLLVSPPKKEVDTRERFLWTGKGQGYWTYTRDIKTIILEEGQKESLLDDMTLFFRSRQWYSDRGIHFQKGYLFAGPPGTGKTSAATALCGALPPSAIELERWDLSSMMDSDFRAFWHHRVNEASNQGKGRFVIMEEVDTLVNAQSREGVKDSKDSFGVSLASLLAAFDGSLGTNHLGAIIILTTNYPDRLDPALIRAGRVDRKEWFGYFGPDEVLKMSRLFLDESDAVRFAATVNTPIAPCDLQVQLMEECGMATKKKAFPRLRAVGT